ncbi:hypothetical protein K7X08_000583 [Anisodus acutangulus]|uniref:Uncharacterized protein n=1 Tax=Anisodus acutangulus TaxID=402998 RepID=A0A9Q1RB29_9SOLA|nr:hypothetical protein K7X08_000583 [Anisodus acutangulus]
MFDIDDTNVILVTSVQSLVLLRDATAVNDTDISVDNEEDDLSHLEDVVDNGADDVIEQVEVPAQVDDHNDVDVAIEKVDIPAQDDNHPHVAPQIPHLQSRPTRTDNPQFITKHDAQKSSVSYLNVV